MATVFPSLYKVTQHFDAHCIEDVYGNVHSQLRGLIHQREGIKGKSVAVAVGSRGIDNLPQIVCATVDALREQGLRPFVIPAMGSHGGATAQGQIEVLAALGVTEEIIGVPIVSSMDVVSLGRIPSGAEVFFSQSAIEADYMTAIARIKPHTLFRADVESGLCKLLAVGCGKHRGALELHRFDVGKQIVPAAQLILSKIPVLCGVAVVENSYHKISKLTVVGADAFVDSDRQLLLEAKKLLPKIPVEDLDILIVDEIGKNISGGGMDPNVYGFWRRDGGERKPDYRTIIVLDLTQESHGNAVGIGMADLITKRLADMIDWNATYLNAITSGVFRAGRMPIVAPHDREALQIALDILPNPENARIIRIINTLDLECFWASGALLPELSSQSNLTVDKQPYTFCFDKDARLLSFKNNSYS